MNKILEIIGTIENRMIDHQVQNGFETIFDFIGEDLQGIKDEVNNNSSISICSKIEQIIEATANQHPYKEKGNRDSYSSYNQGWSDACDILGERVKEVVANYCQHEAKSSAKHDKVETK